MLLDNRYPGVSSQNGIYRAAFPAYRVFIFGKEVTRDVASVNVNQSGGSLDRATGTCSITLLNRGGKYVFNYEDTLNSMKKRDSKYKPPLMMDSDEKLDILRKLGFSSEAAFHSAVIAKGLSVDIPVSKVSPEVSMTTGASSAAMELWSNRLQAEDPPVKFEILSEKIGARPYPGSQNFTYPIFEGDCIFHPNDPVRVAFRDPFYPSIWWWSFTGFVDSATENENTNLESEVVITCTDVLKTLRYSLVQTNVDAVRDPELSKTLKAMVGEEVFSNLGKLNWMATQNIFAKMTLPDIIDIIFFGTSEKDRSLEVMAERWRDSLWGLVHSKDDSYKLKLAYKFSIEKADTLPTDEFFENLMNRVTSRWSDLQGSLSRIKTPAGVSFKANLSSSQLWRIHPYFVKGTGVSVEEDSYEYKVDQAFSQEIDLPTLNTFLSHQVCLSDLETMLNEDETKKLNTLASKETFRNTVLTPAQRSQKDPLTPQERESLFGPEEKIPDYYVEQLISVNSVTQVIDIIGKDIKRYPVGGGRVFYIAPAGFQGGLISGVVEEDPNGGTSDLHSEYKDLLTYLFDLADVVQFCCYATPRGDVVFEMPFFDYNPADFTVKGEMESAERLIEVSAQITSWAAGSAKYSAEDICSLVQLSSDLHLASAGLSVKDDVTRPDFDKYFIVEKADTISSSNAVNDSGLKTVARVMRKSDPRRNDTANADLWDYQYEAAPDTINMLGIRMAADISPWMNVSDAAGAKQLAGLHLNRTNSEARTVGLTILPKFGLMVNRPLYWRRRNMIANIVNAQHTLAANSSCGTTINLNYARAWNGKVDVNGNEIYSHFGGDLPFNYTQLLPPVKEQPATPATTPEPEQPKKKKKKKKKK